MDLSNASDRGGHLSPDASAGPPGDECIFVLAPLGRDAELASAALAQAGFSTRICRDLPDIIDRLSNAGDDCGAVLIAEESLLTSEVARFTGYLESQPAWSDLPVVILTQGRITSELSPSLLQRFAPHGNITLLERPLRVITLRSIMEVALRARRRQYEVRDLIREREAVLSSERAARTEAEKANRMKDEFLATLSHELRTPLNAILGWTSILRGVPEDRMELEQGLEIIERNARAQAVIIDDLLDMSRIISGKINLEVVGIHLGALIESAVKTVRPGADAREIALEVAIDPSLGAFCGDPNRLQQVFYNLLTNAIKFTPPGGSVRVNLRQLEAAVEVSIRDSGMGIEPEFLPLVFDRFRQANASSTRKHGGLGLGLAIVKNLIELHGGQVRAESAGLGCGSTFIVTLPVSHKSSQTPLTTPELLPTLDPAGVPPDAREPWKSAPRLDGIHVLVVDDEPDTLSMMRRFLQESGAQVTTASSAADAFAAFQSGPPDILVSDIGMPGENGYSLIRRVRALPVEHGGVVPAVAVTAYARAEDREQAEQAGFNDHLTKPIDAARLLDLLASLTCAAD
ncbi:MAG: ATP-binding protein [Chthoniobacterales bacterium]